VTGTAAADVILAAGSNGHVDGLGGDDLICGRVALDVMNGGPGDDRLKGEPDGFHEQIQAARRPVGQRPG
jgi:hypothetical protein